MHAKNDWDKGKFSIFEALLNSVTLTDVSDSHQVSSWMGIHYVSYSVNIIVKELKAAKM